MTDVTTEVSTEVDAPPAVPEAAPVPFWQRPMIERYFMPFIVPIAVVLGIVVFVLNISRVFLAAHGHISVVICSVVLVLILLGATVLANASLRTTSIALMTTGFVFVIFVSGWLVLGSSAEKKEGNAASCRTSGPVNGTINITAPPTGGLNFAPSSVTETDGYLPDRLQRRSERAAHARLRPVLHAVPGARREHAGRDTESADLLRDGLRPTQFYCAFPGTAGGCWVSST